MEGKLQFHSCLNTRLHLSKFAAWRLMCRGLTVSSFEWWELELTGYPAIDNFLLKTTKGMEGRSELLFCFTVAFDSVSWTSMSQIISFKILRSVHKPNMICQCKQEQSWPHPELYILSYPLFILGKLRIRVSFFTIRAKKWTVGIQNQFLPDSRRSQTHCCTPHYLPFSTEAQSSCGLQFCRLRASVNT